MTPVIVPCGSVAYVGAMHHALAKLLLMLAVILMPFGMAAPAAAAAHHAPPAAAMPMQHCPDQGTSPHATGGFADCTMACAAALPAGDPRRDVDRLVVSAPAVAPLLARLAGLHPHPATPPPRNS